VSVVDWRERVLVAYLDEPPFGIPPGAGARPSGCDVEVAHRVLAEAGATEIEFELTTFPELIPGLVEGRWHVSTAMFITDERAPLVDFSRPVWAAADGFIVRRGEEGRFGSYEDIARADEATLAVVTGQVQRHTARDAGVPAERIIEFVDQEAAAEAVRQRRADASASTAVGNVAYVERAGDGGLVAIADRPIGAERPQPLGAFAFSKETPELTTAFDAVLARYLGTAEHLALMARHGFARDDLAPALP